MKTLIAFGAVIAILLFAVMKIYGYGCESCKKAERSEWQAKQTESIQKHADELSAHQEALRLQGIELGKKITELDAAQLQGEKNFEIGQDILLDNIMSGKYKLHLPEEGDGERSVGGGSEEETSDSSTASGCLRKARSALPAKVTAKLFRLTGDADKLAKDYNYLVDYTKTIMESCFAKNSN